MALMHPSAYFFISFPFADNSHYICSKTSASSATQANVKAFEENALGTEWPWCWLALLAVVFTGFYAVGSMEWNEFRIDRCESRRGQVSCPACRESLLLDVERKEDNFLQVCCTRSPLRPHAQITRRHTEWLQASLPIQDLLFSCIKRYAELYECHGLTGLSLQPQKRHPEEHFYFYFVLACLSCIALMHIRILLSLSPFNVFIILEIWCSAFYSHYKKELFDLGYWC